MPVPHPVSEPVRTLDPQRLGDHVDRLYRAARAMTGGREDAEDLVQETLARVLSKPRQVRSDSDLGYLLCALRNTWAATLRTRSRRPQTAWLSEQLEPEDPRGDLRPDAAIECGEVLATVRELAEPFRDAVIAVDVAGLSYAEAALALGVPQGTIMSRLYRGRKQVVQRLG